LWCFSRACDSCLLSPTRRLCLFNVNIRQVGAVRQLPRVCSAVFGAFHTLAIDISNCIYQSCRGTGCLRLMGNPFISSPCNSTHQGVLRRNSAGSAWEGMRGRAAGGGSGDFGEHLRILYTRFPTYGRCEEWCRTLFSTLFVPRIRSPVTLVSTVIHSTDVVTRHPLVARPERNRNQSVAFLENSTHASEPPDEGKHRIPY